jgi:myo-inositol-1(or 4)-monophosphatase
MSDIDRHRLLALADHAAQRASDALLAQRGDWGAVEAEAGREVKVRADRYAEALIVDALQAQSAYRILSEEVGWIAGAESGLLWAVDPLDGSVNYAQGFPHWAVSIALVRGTTPLLGVVLCPQLGERFTGIAGEGAWLNGAPIRVSAVADPARGVLMTGIPARAVADQPAMAAFATRLSRWRKVRMIGSAACAIVAVAAGRADAYHENGGMLWDIAGGCAVAEGAGATVAITATAADAPLDVRVTNGVVAL